MAVEAVLAQVGTTVAQTMRFASSGTSVGTSDVFELDLSKSIGVEAPAVELLYLRVTGVAPATRVDPIFYSASTPAVSAIVYQPAWVDEADAGLAFVAADGPVFLPLTTGKVWIAPGLDATADCSVEVVVRSLSVSR